MKLLAVAAVAEAATGLSLLVLPSPVGRLLLGVELAGVAIPVAQVTAIALIALAVACWPGSTALCGMLTYSALATLLLLYLGFRGEWVGLLLWPAVVLHAVITILLGRAWLMSQKQDGGTTTSVTKENNTNLRSLVNHAGGFRERPGDGELVK